MTPSTKASIGDKVTLPYHHGEARMPEELPRRYIAIRRYSGKGWQPVSAVVWDSIPGREGEVWLTHVRPVVRLALEGAGLLSRAQKFVNQAYYLGSYDEVLRLAMEYVEVR
jgi:hypothetical protein